MRKTLTQALLAAFCAILARGTSAAHVEGGGVMQIASKISMWSGARTPTAKDYVQDGLVYQLDGIENDGFGKHLARGPWRDLVSGDVWATYTGDFTATAYHAQSIDALTKSLYLAWPEAARKVFADGIYTIEIRGKSSIGNSTTTSPRSVFQTVVGANPVRIGVYNQLAFTFQIGGVNTFLGPGILGLPSDELGRYQFDVTGWQNGTAGGFKVMNADYEKSLTNCTTGTPSQARILVNSDCDALWYAVRIYSRALTADEIAANYAIDKERFGLT